MTKRSRGRFLFLIGWLTLLPTKKHQNALILALLGLILVGGGILGSKFQSAPEEGIEILPADGSSAATILVDLQGAINQPGLYELAADSRVNDLLIKAGGLSAAADREWVAKNLNLAQKLTDGAKLYIQSQSEAAAAPALTAAGQVSGVNIGSQININTASLNELCQLPGIGQTYAQRIIDYRPYQAVEDLLKVPGIGSKTLEKIKDQITVY